MKLTPPQMECLKLSAQEAGFSAHEDYTPTRKLVELGLVTRVERRLSQPLFHATEAGRKVLEEKP